MTFRPGDSKPAGSGRQRGVANHSTRAVREAIVEAFDRAGGVEYLVGLATTHPEIFARLLVRLVPSEIPAKVDGMAPVVVVFDDQDRQEMEALDERKHRDRE